MAAFTNLVRDYLFISHANPEDNEFALWLTLQLAKQGYPVWCDLTQLLGGEDHWNDINKFIRERTCKFLYVVSRTSNEKDGVLKELQVAENVAKAHQLHDFIIPLGIDDLDSRDYHIQLTRINSINFAAGWANGLTTLIENLEREGIQKSASFNPSAVASWWRSQNSADRGIQELPEECVSNWFPITLLPETMYFHTMRRNGIGPIKLTEEPPYPAFEHGQYLLSFAPAEDFKDKLGSSLYIEESLPVQTSEMIRGNPEGKFLDQGQARDFLYRLLRDAWQRMLVSRGLPTYTLANEAQCFYFAKDAVESDRAYYSGIDGKQAYRQVVGFRTKRTASGEENKRVWHLGVQAIPIVYPTLAYIVKLHVLFSDDGKTIWDDKKRLHRARRNQCSNWWNDDWRDRMLASLTWLADADGKIILPVGSTVCVEVDAVPLRFLSPVSYIPAEVSPSILSNVEESNGDVLYEDEDEEEE